MLVAMKMVLVTGQIIIAILRQQLAAVIGGQITIGQTAAANVCREKILNVTQHLINVVLKVLMQAAIPVFISSAGSNANK